MSNLREGCEKFHKGLSLNLRLFLLISSNISSTKTFRDFWDAPRTDSSNTTEAEWKTSCNEMIIVWANYNDVSRGHLKLWFSKGIPPKSP